MSKLTWLEWLGVLGTALVVAVLVFLGLLQVNHWRQDEANLHAVIQLLNYNVAEGKLAVVPAAAPVALGTPVPPPVKAPDPKP